MGELLVWSDHQDEEKKASAEYPVDCMADSDYVNR